MPVDFRCQIPGDPVPWVNFNRGHEAPSPGFFKMKAWQTQIQAWLIQEWQQEPLEGPVLLECWFYLPWPDSAPQRNARAIDKWWWKHLAMKPDVDNMKKCFSDACEGILFHGDQQLVGGEPRKDILRPTFYKNPKQGFTTIRFRPYEGNHD